MDVFKLGAFIRACRKDLGMTQGELATKLNVTDKAISRWERGIGFPDIQLIKPLAEALKISVQELMQCQKVQSTYGLCVESADQKYGRCVRIDNYSCSIAVVFFLAYIIFESLRNLPMFASYLWWMSKVSMLLFLTMVCAFLFAAYRKEENCGV